MRPASEVLSPEQVFGRDWLSEREGSYLADPPGFGKTRQLLAAAEDCRHVTVVCPAAIRDAKVWEREAKLIGFDRPITSISYHQLMNPKTQIAPGGALIFDEAHRLKSRKVTWRDSSMDAAAQAVRVHLASGTPTPNGYLPELYQQMKLIHPDYPQAYWNNKAGTGWIETWFVRTTNKYTEYYVPGTLKGCNGLPCADPSFTGDCVHRQEFWAANVGDYMLRRPEELLDLPELAGFDVPIDTPMTPVQRRAYLDMKKHLIAELPEAITLEALTASQKFAHLMKLTTGVTSVDPDANPKDSGKRTWLEETLPDREHPTVLGVYFRNSATAMAKLCEDLGLRYAMYGAGTPKKDQIIEEFQRGGIDVLVASIMVVREGITLTAADQVVLAERSWVPGDNEQTVRRVRRRGQTKPVIARQLVVPKTVDEGQWEVLQSKTGAIGQLMTKAEVMAML